MDGADERVRGQVAADGRAAVAKLEEAAGDERRKGLAQQRAEVLVDGVHLVLFLCVCVFVGGGFWSVWWAVAAASARAQRSSPSTSAPSVFDQLKERAMAKKIHCTEAVLDTAAL